MSGQEAKEKGNSAFKAGDFAAAIGHYTAAILADPKNATFPLNRAAAYLKLGKSEDAERDCARVIELDSKNVKAWFRRGQARGTLSRLEEAKADFERVLRLEPNNEAAQQELKKVTQSIKERDARMRPRTPASVDIPPASAPAHPKRRRVPINIIDDNSLPSPILPVQTQAQQESEGLIQAVSSRPLTESTKGSDVRLTSTEQPSSSSTPEPSTSNIRKATTFKEAKQAREAQQVRPGGGIFRSNGQHTLFETRPKHSSSSTPPTQPVGNPVATEVKTPDHPPPTPTPLVSSKAQSETVGFLPLTPAASAPMTLFSFNRAWESTKMPTERWKLLQQVPPTSIPSLFKTSLEASALVSILETMQTILLDPSVTAETRALVRDYLISLARVPRFSVVVLFMSPAERRLVKDVWNLLGDPTSGDASARKAWSV